MTHNDTAWRAAAASCPGYATYPDTPPGDPSWWRRTGTGTAPWRPAAFTTTDPDPLDGPATTPPPRRVPTDPFRAPETPADAAPTPTPAPRPASAATDTPPAAHQPLRILSRQGYRLAAPGSPVPWLRRCAGCGHTGTPVEGRRIPRVTPATIDPDAWPEPEPCNVCPTCSAAAPGPHVVALYLALTGCDAYRLTLLHGDRIHQHEVSGHLARDPSRDRRGLVDAWRCTERHLLRSLAPTCGHPRGCAEVARDRYEPTMPIQWAGTWLMPGRTLLLCGRHGAELHQHILTGADPILGPYATMPVHQACPREPLPWTQV
ncbi:hypothetical protein [Micromonospora aurantiaca]|uniref:Uncharacterized protein n=1 Tax=Micromonospora aurantiaca (nom. illeg.) TaxID=47850 RepID=A0A6N3JTR1_9ACTN|nr:hypothetical protein [Micromonospora aurantiaca]AXH88782.1 hypothetical protein DVH21_01920 [Micromonospora aurantiaca]